MRTSLFAAVLALAACHGPELRTGVAARDTPVVALPAAPQPDFIENFPCDSSPTQRRDAEAMTLLTGSPQQPNEVHDCQRLVVGGQFGPLVGVLPVDSFAALDTAAAFDEARPVASIYNWGGPFEAETYAPLRVARGWNCLWLVRDPRNGQWDAAIVAGAPDGCLHIMPDTPLDTRYLEVHRRVYPDSIPRTARWAWDDQRDEHYIGIKCADGWCWIGANGFRPAPVTGGLVPGWYDEQQLAVYDSTAGRLVPGPWGRIAPYPAPRRLDVPAFIWQSGGGQRVATVTLTGDAAHLRYYANKRGFETRQTDLWLYKEASADVNAGWEMMMVEHDPRPSPPRPNAASGPVFRVSRIPGVMHATPGAVRWRWSDSDEVGWNGCGSACCTPVGTRLN